MKKRIMDGALHVFQTHGIKFTMDDLARELGMSKKTIYTVFPDKNTLLCELVDYVFAAIKESETAVLRDEEASLSDKIRGILSAMPESYRELDLTQLYIYKDKYPKAYQSIVQHLESGWEMTYELMEQGIKEGVLRKDVNYTVFQMMYEASLERFITEGELQKNHISYMDAFHSMVDIMMGGILESE